jgi:hypothetical protein
LSSLIAPLEGIVDADHLCLTTPPWSARVAADRPLTFYTNLKNAL